MNDTFNEALKVLQKSGVIVFKTDTVMGLGVNGEDAVAVKIFLNLRAALLISRCIYLHILSRKSMNMHVTFQIMHLI